MREKYDKQLYLEFSGNATLKVVKEYRAKYKSISKILDKNPKILSLVHTDIKHANKSSNKGRSSNTRKALRADSDSANSGSPKTLVQPSW